MTADGLPSLRRAGVLAAAVAVKHQPVRWPARLDRRVEALAPSQTRSAVMCSRRLQPTNLREYKSMMTHELNQPCLVHRYVMSLTHAVFGATTSKRRPSRAPALPNKPHPNRFGATGSESFD